MANIGSLIKKYGPNVDFHIWRLIEYAITRYEDNNETIFTKKGRIDVNSDDIDIYVNPEVILFGLADMFMLFYEYDDEIIKSKGRDGDGIDKGVVRCILSMLDTDDKIRGYKYLIRLMKKHMKVEDGKTSMDDIMPISSTTLQKDPIFNKLMDVLSNFANSRLVNRDVSFYDMLIKIFDKAKRERSFVDCHFFLNLCIEELFIARSANIDSSLDYTFTQRSLIYGELRKKLSEKIVGQDYAIRHFIKGLFVGGLRPEGKRKSPEATFLFVGPPGVGKTYLASLAAEYLNRKSMIIQMNEYAHESDYHGLVGFSRTYRDSRPGMLTSFVDENPDAIIIFDEVEKAHPNTTRLLLSVLEGGFLQDTYFEKDIDFSDTIIIITTNAGRLFYEENRNMKISSIPETTIIDALKKDKNERGIAVMPTEILSRLAKGNIIGFDHIKAANLVSLIKNGMSEGKRMIEDNLKINCVYDETQLPYLFLYHLGESVDARVASERSKKFIIDNTFNLAERVAENPEKYSENIVGNIDIVTSLDEDLAKELLIPTEKSNIVVVAYKEDRKKIKNDTDMYHKLNVTGKTAEALLKKITDAVKTKDISAIFVDPYYGSVDEEEDAFLGAPENLEGLVHVNRHGMYVINHLLQMDDMPKVYILENHNHIALTDQIEISGLGAAGIIDLIGKDQKECTKCIDDIIYELFLSEKLNKLGNRGRALDFELSNQITEEGIHLLIHNYKLVNNMSTDAADVVVNDDNKPKETFDDVVGAENAKQELRRFKSFLQDPKKYAKDGMQVSKGILLYGPAGTGKTKLAKALASEADCPFISATGAQFVMGEKDITKVFALARKYAPSILFIDEIDALAKDRERNGSSEHTTNLLNTLLTEMDGFSTDKSRPVFVIAATNAGGSPGVGGEDIRLDKALLRRFSKRVYVDLPDTEERYKFMIMHKKALKNKNYNFNNISDEEIKTFARLSFNRSLAELENVINLVIGKVAEENAFNKEENPDAEPRNVELSDIIEVLDESTYGEKIDIAEHHLKMTAYHEAGHAFLGFYGGEKFYPEYATLIGRGDFLGMVQPKISDEADNYSRMDYIKLIRVKLAGRAAEMVFSKEAEDGLTDGASNDLAGATFFAKKMLSFYGMEEGFLPVFTTLQGRYTDIMDSPLAEMYFRKINEIMQRELDETIKIISENKKQVESIAKALILSSRLDTEDMLSIIKKIKK